MNNEFERCCTFLAEMMEKYASLVLLDILEETQFDPDTWHPADVGCIHIRRSNENIRLIEFDENKVILHL